MLQYARCQNLNPDPLMLTGVSLTGRLQGALFEARVEQRFQNPTPDNVAVIYTFPLPHGAVLLDMAVRLGDRLLTGCVIGKRQAETRYEATLAEGHAAIMLERNPDGTHTLNLGNLGPHETCIVSLRYGQALAFEQGGLRLLIPTVLAPRYGDPLTDGGLRPHQVVEHSPVEAYPFTLTLDLLDELARARISSPSHPIALNHTDPAGQPAVRVTLTAPALLDRDVILQLDALPVNALSVVSRDMVCPDQTAVLISLCPRLRPDKPLPITVKLLVDCSGSMAGDSMVAARRALLAIVAQLGEGDRFSLSRFGNTVAHRTRGLWVVKPATRRSAQRWIADLDADMGGTEMESALVSTFGMGHEMPSDVLLITDGDIYAIDSLLQTARAAGQRIFVVGIGSSPTEAHLRRLADATGGACDFVAPGENAEPAIVRMFARLRSPRLAHVHLQWPANAQPVWHSPLPPAVFDGDTLHVFAGFQGMPEGDIVLRGRRGPNAEPETIGQATLDGCRSESDLVPRMAAHARIRAEDDIDPTERAVAYQLVTATTNFLLVHQRAPEEQAAAKPALHPVRHRYPAGWGGSTPNLVKASLTGLAEEVPDPEYLDVPMFLRRTRDTCTTPQVATRSARGAARFLDIPAFLRRQQAVAERQQSLQRDATTGYLTPLGLVQYLAQHPPDQWPTQYADLTALGLLPAVIDWLAEIFADEYPEPVGEAQVVASFLLALLQVPTLYAIQGSAGLFRRLMGKFERFLRGSRDQRVCPDPRLVTDLLAYLEDTTATAWSDLMQAEAASA